MSPSCQMCPRDLSALTKCRTTSPAGVKFVSPLGPFSFAFFRAISSRLVLFVPRLIYFLVLAKDVKGTSGEASVLGFRWGPMLCFLSSSLSLCVPVEDVRWNFAISFCVFMVDPVVACCFGHSISRDLLA